jgi:hypothetical protein
MVVEGVKELIAAVNVEVERRIDVAESREGQALPMVEVFVRAEDVDGAIGGGTALPAIDDAQ